MQQTTAVLGYYASLWTCRRISQARGLADGLLSSVPGLPALTVPEDSP